LVLAYAKQPPATAESVSGLDGTAHSRSTTAGLLSTRVPAAGAPGAATAYISISGLLGIFYLCRTEVN